MKNIAKKFLKRMSNTGGFIADGIYEDLPRFWHSSNRCSSKLMDISLYYYLKNNGYIMRDRTGRFLISKKGKNLITPWYKKILI